MAAYNINLENGNILRTKFGDPAQSDQIVKDASIRIDEMIQSGEVAGGEIIFINGPINILVAMALAHRLGHLYQAVACFDPRLGKYVVSIAHGDRHSIGDLID